MNPRRYRRQRYYARRRRRNWWPWVVFVAVAALFFWAIFQFFLALFSNVRSESISVELTLEQGRAEFLLAENETWNPAFSEQKFLEGDSIRTAKNSRVLLTFLEKNRLWLDSDTQLKIVELTQKSSGTTKAAFALESGQAWAEIDGNTFNVSEDSALTLETNRSRTYVRGTTLSIKHTDTEDFISLISGQADVDVFGPDDKELNVQVGVGQSLVINDSSYSQISAGESLLTAIDQTFEESDWYLDNLERQDPEKAASIRERLKPVVSEENGDTNNDDFFDNLELDTAIEAPTITTPVQGERISADVDLMPIRGTAPAEAFQIQVNDYVLQRFEPGDRAWTYIAATEYGTLKPGDNRYDVVAITREGKRSELATLEVFYEGTATVAAPVAPVATPTPVTNDTSIDEVVETAPVTTTAGNLSVPVVTRPALFAADPTAVYETSSTVVTFGGTVSSATQAVEVNGFRLQKFSPGDTEFSYIANANYGNMKEGENLYTIKALGADGSVVQTQITIFYRPVSLD